MEAQRTKMSECCPPLHTYCTYFTAYSTFLNPPLTVAQHRLVVQGLIIEASRSHSDAPNSRRTPLEEWSVRRKDLYLTTRSTQNRQTSMPTAGFELTIPPRERRQIHDLHLAAAEIGRNFSVRMRTWLVGLYWYIPLLCGTINSVYVQ
jgi:hypothetical protein